jgi:hypothetical protein
MGACSIPELLGLKAWFDSRFNDCCEWHDERYVARDCYKMWADWGVSVRIAKKHPKYIVVGALSFVALTINPVAYRMWYTE